MSRPRILAIIGSGETAPTLAKVHRSLLAQLDPADRTAVLLDTPYGFQENAAEISGRTVDYFRESVGVEIGIASFRSADADPLERATAVARIREAGYLFTGPGSPSYALRTWRESEIPACFAERLATGGILSVASAASLTLGLVTVPVYEIYKVGEPPRWLEGLDLLSPYGLRCAVIPHYDNAEGGSHDTRFCYLGERRLARLEAALPAGAWILGVDGHTALVLDLDARTATVAGNGGVTIRAAGRSTVLPSGTSVGLERLAGIAAELADGAGGSGDGMDGAAATTAAAGPAGGSPDGDGARGAGADGGAPSLRDAVRRADAGFAAAVAARDADGAVRAILELDGSLVAWSSDTGGAEERTAAASALRGLIVRLGELGVGGLRDPREAVAPFVAALLELRERARAGRDWAAADLIRDRLLAAGIEVRDTPEGTDWEIVAPQG
jgi:cyanophycinase-like exopeptidase